MLAIKEAKALIDAANINGIDAVYTANIPRDVQDTTNKTIVLLTDANSKPTLYGSNDFNALNREIEVQVFYALDLARDPELIDVDLYKAFAHNSWDLGENHGHTYDPDTHQLTSTFYVYSLKII